MAFNNDWRELLAHFHTHKVEFVIVGAHALAHHGAPRATGDLDLLLRPTEANARRVLLALADFGFGSLDIKVEDLSKAQRVVQLGFPPFRIDLLTTLTGLTWDEVAAGVVASTYGDVPVGILGRAELIRNKRALGRLQDLADVERLEG